MEQAGVEPAAELQSGAELLDNPNPRTARQGARTEAPGEHDGLSLHQVSDARVAELLGLVSSARALLQNLTNENDSHRAWLDLFITDNSRLSNRVAATEGRVENLYSQMTRLKMKLRTAEAKRMKLAVALDDARRRLKLKQPLQVTGHQAHALEPSRSKLKDKSTDVLLAGTITL
jgi:chromosome segregation ATPase